MVGFEKSRKSDTDDEDKDETVLEGEEDTFAAAALGTATTECSFFFWFAKRNAAGEGAKRIPDDEEDCLSTEDLDDEAEEDREEETVTVLGSDTGCLVGDDAETTEEPILWISIAEPNPALLRASVIAILRCRFSIELVSLLVVVGFFVVGSIS